MNKKINKTKTSNNQLMIANFDQKILEETKANISKKNKQNLELLLKKSEELQKQISKLESIENINKAKTIEANEEIKTYKYSLVFDNKLITNYFKKYLSTKDISLDFIDYKLIKNYDFEGIKKLLIKECNRITSEVSLEIKIKSKDFKKAKENSQMSKNEYINFTIDALLANDTKKALQKFKTLIKNYYKANNLTIV